VKKIVLIKFLSIFILCATATISPPDTLLIKIKERLKNDTIKVEMLIDYCVANTFNQKDTILLLAQEANKGAQLHWQLLLSTCSI
jgi:two-component system, LytTR family, sensor kinase